MSACIHSCVLQEQLNTNLCLHDKYPQLLSLHKGYLKWHDVRIGAILVNLIHCALKSDCLLSQVFQVLRALFGLFMVFSKLIRKGEKREKKKKKKGYNITNRNRSQTTRVHS